ncbi:MAG: response regulator transcription factor [Actinomycetota bacterium]
MRILLIEDERAFAQLLARRLTDAGHDVSLAYTGTSALQKAGSESFDAALLDVMLPELDGFQILEILRKSGSSLPVIMLTARDTVADRVLGLQTGADDYLVKPFAFAELLARLDAITRRLAPKRKLLVGNVVVDVASRMVEVDGNPVELTVKEFDTLEYLVRNAGRVVSRRELKESVWGFSFDAETKVVDLYVHYLRRKLKHAGAKDLIQTVRGIGYAIGRRMQKEK